MNNRVKLINNILEFSNNKDWENAKNEWVLNQIWYHQGNCICGHKIVENCQIINIKNKNKLVVGNCCIKKFMSNIESDKLFRSVKKIKIDIGSVIGIDLLSYIIKNKVINDWELKFYSDTYGLKYKKMTIKQKETRVKINKKILSNLGIE